MSHDIIKKTESMPINNMDDLARLSEMFAKSGYFTDAREAAQIGTKVLAGRELGFGPFASVNGIHLIQGKPSMGANLMAAAVKASGKYDFRVREISADVCKIEFFQGSESLGVSEFTRKDAEAAGTQNLKKFARNMLYARAMSNGVRWFTPDVFMGAAVYTPEELGATVDGEGDIVDAPHAPAAEPEKPAKGKGKGSRGRKGKSKAAEAPQELGDVPAEEDPFPESDPDAEPLSPAPERPLNTLSEDEAGRLQKALSDRGVPDALELAREVTGHSGIEALMDLTKEESRRVFAAADGGNPEEEAA